MTFGHEDGGQAVTGSNSGCYVAVGYGDSVRQQASSGGNDSSIIHYSHSG